MRLSLVLALAATALSIPAAAQMTQTAPRPAAANADPVAAERVKPFQYLYGSAEAAGLSIQSWHALVDFARQRVRHRPRDSVVLAEGSSFADPHFVPCGKKPLAAVFDVDETSILNLGLEANAAAGVSTGGGMVSRWAQTGANAVAPVPGAVFGVNALRKMGVTVIFNTNRSNKSAEGTADAIAAAGLGRPVHLKTLFLAGDDAMGSRKDGRRWTIARDYCVIAMAGDQLVDISDLFNARDLSVADRRQAATRGWVAQMWGNGWWVLPNPVYGSGLQGGIDEIFPADKRWTDTGAGQ
uniref:HAD family acid phosphatase n=1 Tax=Altererythrobacter segetis TaxID=1104773 RepID=UPI00140B78A6|nr:HAD family acid phosphatase [Altererythrobacter segetis]